MNEEISREEIAALLARGSEEMTRDQACDTLRNAAWLGTDEERERIEKAVELLCGEPCDDAIKRNAVIQTLNKMDRYTATELTLCGTDKKFSANEVFIVDDVYEQIAEQLPPATPKQRTGHWIDVFGGCECSQCGCLEAGYSDYCPDCGCRMVEPQESEE